MMSEEDKILIVTGESSGELYGALLSRAIKTRRHDIRVYGVGGERMRSEGVELISGITGALGLTEAISSVKALRNTLSQITRLLEEAHPAVVILIDFPDFNLKVAKRAKALGIKVLYYVSPQIWAWRKGRIETIKRLSDRIAVILPFEEDIYRGAGANVEFVGHPMMDEIRRTSGEKSSFRKILGIETEDRVLALLPGSRHNELKRLLPLFTTVVARLKDKYPDLRYILPAAPNLSPSETGKWFSALEEMGVRIVKGMTNEALSASDAAIVTSGTATLQTALLGIPMVVVYKLSPLTYWLGRLIIKVKHISLVNLLLGREVVKELIQREASADNIMMELDQILNDQGKRADMDNSFKEIRSFYDGKNASERVAEIAIELTEESPSR